MKDKTITIKFKESEVQNWLDELKLERTMLVCGLIRNQNNEVDEPLDSPRHQKIAQADERINKLETMLNTERRTSNGQFVFAWFDLRK